MRKELEEAKKSGEEREKKLNEMKSVNEKEVNELRKELEEAKKSGEEREKANISQLSHFPDIREIPIFWKQTHQGLVPVKEKEQLKNLSEVMTSILW